MRQQVRGVWLPWDYCPGEKMQEEDHSSPLSLMCDGKNEKPVTPEQEKSLCQSLAMLALPPGTYSSRDDGTENRKVCRARGRLHDRSLSHKLQVFCVHTGTAVGISNPSAEGHRDKAQSFGRIPRAHGTTSLTESVSPRFSGRPCLKTYGGQQQRKALDAQV